MFFLGSRCLVWLSVMGCKFVIIVVGWRVCILVYVIGFLVFRFGGGGVGWFEFFLCMFLLMFFMVLIVLVVDFGFFKILGGVFLLMILILDVISFVMDFELVFL